LPGCRAKTAPYGRKVMPNYLLDTNIIIDSFRGEEYATEVLAILNIQDNLGCTCPIVIGEIYAGIKDKERDKYTKLFKALSFYPLTEESSRQGGEIKNSFAKKGISLSLDDCLIAATCVENDLILVTKNQKDFPMPEIKLFNFKH